MTISKQAGASIHKLFFVSTHGIHCWISREKNYYINARVIYRFLCVYILKILENTFFYEWDSYSKKMCVHDAADKSFPEKKKPNIFLRFLKFNTLKMNKQKSVI